MTLFVGTAAWSIPKDFASLFETEGSHLERYAKTLNAVEINTSFYREHKSSSYTKWASMVPEDFRFSVKLWKHFTHEQRLIVNETELANNLAGIQNLGARLGPLLIQLPPSFDFQDKALETFFRLLRKIYPTPVAIEPRHKSFNSPRAQQMLKHFEIARVIADPDPSAWDFQGSDQSNLCYIRLHGSPEIYKSNYEGSALVRWQQLIAQHLGLGQQLWCIFDNTTFGFATQNAVETLAKMKRSTARADQIFEKPNDKYS